MARVRKSTLSFDAITLEGSLLSSAKFAAAAERKAEEQTDADYGIPKGLTLRDETARYFRIGQALFRDLHASNTPARHKTVEFTEQLLRVVFGFSDIQVVKTPKFRDDRLFPVTMEALGGRVPVVVVPPSDGLDHASNSLSQDRRRSAASALQDWLNADEAAVWGLCTNGESLRLLRDNESLTRPAYLEADLRQIFEAEDYAGFSALWLVLHVTRFGRLGALPADCPLERWRESGSKEGLAARDRLRDGVEAALLALGTGFLTNPANTELSARLREGTWPIDEYFRQLLRLVYRLIFLLAAEDRGLLHIPETSEEQRKLYAQGYSLGALRDRAIRRSGWDNFHDRWSGLRVTFRALASGAPRLGLPALGGIFATTATPELDRSQVSNRFLMEAIFRLAWLRDDGLLMPVNWRDMETEELGSVYESLLELTPRLSSDGREFKFAEGVQTKGNVRKTSGSYYTPDSLVQVLLDETLDPVLDRVESESEDPVGGLLAVTVLDPACGSGHFLLGAARRIAKRVVQKRCGDIHSEQDRLRALRDVVRSCIHGVDRNPMAIELTKVALWIETIEPGKPLGFLDANIRLGDSLLGISSIEALRKGIPDVAYKPLTGDDKVAARESEKRNRADKGQLTSTFDFSGSRATKFGLPPLAEAYRAFRQLPEDTVAEVDAKRDRFNSAAHDPRLQNLAQAADLYTAAFLTPKTQHQAADANSGIVPTTEDVWTAMRAGTVYGPRIGAARHMASAARAFHWPLEFPDIINAGGFDVVLGNPPWERIKLQEQEFFGAREPEISAAPNAAARAKLIAQLKAAPANSREGILHAEFQTAKRIAEASSVFARVSSEDIGRFPLTGRGDVNTYALFAELFSALTNEYGRSGVIAPTGIATDATTAHFFGSLVERHRLVALYSFDNEALIFPAVHHFTRFALLVQGWKPSSIPTDFCILLRHVEQLEDEQRHFRLSAEQICLVNPNTRTAPLFRSQADASLTTSIYERIPVLLNSALGSAGNPWGLSFNAMFHMSNDSSLFLTAEDLFTNPDASREGNRWIIRQSDHDDDSVANYLPLYEAKLVHHFDHRWATYENLESVDVSLSDKCNIDFEITPRYWISEKEAKSRLGVKFASRDWAIGIRGITNASNERTIIAAVFPSGAAGNSLPLLTPSSNLSAETAVALVACLSSLTLDFVARNKVGGTNLNFFIIEQLPILPPAAYMPDDLEFIASRVLELTYTSHSMAPFARELGFDGPPFPWTEDRRAIVRAELDAWYARAYGLTRDELRYVLDPASVMGADYPSETFRVLKNNEERKFGEYRTERLVLDAWERMERGELHKPEPYRRSVSAPPAALAASKNVKATANQPSLDFAQAGSE
jgi:hypothetical protein